MIQEECFNEDCELNENNVCGHMYGTKHCDAYISSLKDTPKEADQ